jgi:hypothetical protein
MDRVLCSPLATAAISASRYSLVVRTYEPLAALRSFARLLFGALLILKRSFLAVVLKRLAMVFDEILRATLEFWAYELVESEFSEKQPWPYDMIDSATAIFFTTRGSGFFI